MTVEDSPGAGAAGYGDLMSASRVSLGQPLGLMSTRGVSLCLEPCRLEAALLTEALSALSVWSVWDLGVVDCLWVVSLCDTQR